jgi:hypothetical protein
MNSNISIGREIKIILWADYEPYQSEWGDWSKFDFWKSAYDKGYPQKSVEMGINLINAAKPYRVKFNWGIFSCEPFFEWFKFLEQTGYIKKTVENGDIVTIHPHWLEWDGSTWKRQRAPSESQILKSLQPINIISGYPNYFNMVRSGWNTQKTNLNRSLSDVYKEDYGFCGIGDVPKRNEEYNLDKDNFMTLPYDTDSMDNCQLKWRTFFSRALGRALDNPRNDTIFHWWFHIHEITPIMFKDLISWSLDKAKENNIRLNFMNIKELYNEVVSWKT